MVSSTIWLMTLISNSTVDLLKHIIENIAYTDQNNCVSVESGMGLKDD